MSKQKSIEEDEIGGGWDVLPAPQMNRIDSMGSIVSIKRVLQRHPSAVTLANSVAPSQFGGDGRPDDDFGRTASNESNATTFSNWQPIQAPRNKTFTRKMSTSSSYSVVHASAIAIGGFMRTESGDSNESKLSKVSNDSTVSAAGVMPKKRSQFDGLARAPSGGSNMTAITVDTTVTGAVGTPKRRFLVSRKRAAMNRAAAASGHTNTRVLNTNTYTHAH